MSDECQMCGAETVTRSNGTETFAHCPECGFTDFDPFTAHYWCAEPPLVSVSVVLRDYWGDPLQEVEMMGFLSAQGPVSPLDFPPPWTEVVR